MKKSVMRKSGVLSLFFLSLFFALGASSLKAESNTYNYTENFTNTTYKDSAGTTAVWNYTSGNLTLSTESKNQKMPSIDFSSDKELLVSWVGPMISGNVYAQKLDKNGNKIWTNNVKVGPQGNEQHTVGEKPVIVREPVAYKDQMNVFWQDSRDHKLTFQTINSFGNVRLPVYGIQEMKLPSSNAVSDIDATHFSNNAYTSSYVVWVDNRNKNGGDIYLQKIKMGASYSEYQWNSDVKVNSVQDGFQKSPRVAVDGNGDVYVVWSSGRKGSVVVSPTDGGIFMQKFSSSGVRLWSSDMVVSQEGSSPSIDVDLSSDTPAVYVSWQDITASSYNSRKYDIYIQKFDLNGNIAWPNSYRIESGLTSSPSPIVAANQKSNGNGQPVHVAWYNASEKRIKIQGYRQDVIGEVICQYGSNCVGTSYESISSPVLSSDFKGEFDFLQGTLELLTDREPYFYLVWSDKDGGDYDVFAQKFGENGAFVWKKQVNDQDSVSSSSAVAKSLSIADVEKNITRATLNAIDEKPSGTDIDYYMSVNGGSDWKLVSAGKEYVFANKGKDLRWMVALRSDNNILAPVVENISISYKTGDESGKKVSPCDSYGDINLDGYVTAEDSSLAADNITGKVFFGDYEIILADVNNNGRVDIGDVAAIESFVAGSITTFPVCEVEFSSASEPFCGNGVCESGESPYSCNADCTDWEEVFDTQKCVTWHAPNVFNYSPCGNTKIYNVVPGNLLKLSAYGDNCASCVCYHVNFDLYDYISGEWVKIKTVDEPDEKTGIRNIFDYTPKGNQIKIVGTNGCFHFNLYQKKSDSGKKDDDFDSTHCLTDGTLIKLPNDPKIYVIINCKRYWVRTAEEFQRKGYKWENVKETTADVVDSLPEVSELAQEIKEGAIIRATGDVDIYIVKYIGNKKFKRLILNPSVFRSYGHLRWEDVIEVEKETVDSFIISNLVRNAKTGRIYRLTANGDSGIRRHFRSISVMQRLGHDLDAVYEINETDERSYEQGEDLG